MVSERGRSGKGTTISAVCMHCAHDPAANWRKYLDFIDEAARRGTDYLVFPEVSLHGYLMGSPALGTPEMTDQVRYFRRVAEPIPGPTTHKLTELARRHHMLLQVGMAESAMNGNIIYNSAALIDPTGVIGVFRKLHNPFEWPVFSPGNHLSVFPTSLGKIGMFICYDLAFPEISRAFALQGATIAALTTAWPMFGDDPATDYNGYTYDLMSRAMAFANQFWMVCANQVNRPPTPGCADYYGHSRIVAPTGKIVAEIGHEEGLVTATVDLEEGIEDARTRDWFGLNLLEDRRPEFYGIVADRDIYYPSHPISRAEQTVTAPLHQHNGNTNELNAREPLNPHPGWTPITQRAIEDGCTGSQEIPSSARGVTAHLPDLRRGVKGRVSPPRRVHQDR